MINWPVLCPVGSTFWSKTPKSVLSPEATIHIKIPRYNNHHVSFSSYFHQLSLRVKPLGPNAYSLFCFTIGTGHSYARCNHQALITDEKGTLEYTRIWNPVGACWLFSWNTPKGDDAILISAANPYFSTFICVNIPAILIFRNCWIKYVYIFIKFLCKI